MFCTNEIIPRNIRLYGYGILKISFANPAILFGPNTCAIIMYKITQQANILIVRCMNAPKSFLSNNSSSSFSCLMISCSCCPDSQ